MEPEKEKPIPNLLSCAQSEQFEVSPDGQITSKAQKEKREARKKIPSVEVVRKMKRSGKKQCICDPGRMVGTPGDKNEGDVSEKNAARIIITAGDDAKVSLNLILREEIVEEGKGGEMDEHKHVGFEPSQISGIVAGGDNPPCGRPLCPQGIKASKPPVPPCSRPECPQASRPPAPPCGKPECPQASKPPDSPCGKPECPQKVVAPPCNRPLCPQVAHYMQQQASNATYTSTVCYQTSEIRADHVPVGMGNICPSRSTCVVSRGVVPPCRSADQRRPGGQYSESSYRTAQENESIRRALGAPEGSELYNVEIAPSVKTVGSTGLSRSAGIVVEAESKESIQVGPGPQLSGRKLVCTATCSGIQPSRALEASSQESNLSTEIVEAESAAEASKTHLSLKSDASYRTADATAAEKKKSCNRNSCIFRGGALSKTGEPIEKSSGTSYKTAGSVAGVSRSRSKESSRVLGSMSRSSNAFRRQLDASIKSSGASYKTVTEPDGGSQKSGLFTLSRRGSGASRGRDSLSVKTTGSHKSANALGVSESKSSKATRVVERDSYYKGSEKSLRTNLDAREGSNRSFTAAQRSVASIEERSTRLSDTGSHMSRSSYIPEDKEPEADEPETGASGSGGGGGGADGGQGGQAGSEEEAEETQDESEGRCRVLIFIGLLLLMLPFLMLLGAFLALAVCRPLPCFHHYFGQSILGSIFVGKSHETLRAVF